MMRPLSVADTIRMTRLSDPDDDAFGSQGPKFSPDGKRFAIVFKKGDLEHNRNEYTLRIYKIADVLISQKPEALVTLSSSSNRGAIKALKWLSPEQVAFIGESGAAGPQVCMFNVRTKRISRITNHPAPVVAYDISEDGRVVVFEADPPENDLIDNERTRREGISISAERLDEVLLTSSRGSPYAESRQVFMKIGKAKPREIRVDDMIRPELVLSVSPDGRFALIEVFARQIPENWSSYKDTRLRERIAAKRRQSWVGFVERYLLLDTRSGVLEPLFNAPEPWEHYEFAWILGGQSIVLSKAYLPLDVEDPVERAARESNSFVVELRLPSREIIKITDQHLKVGRWDKKTNELILVPRSDEPSVPPRTFKHRDGEWQQIPQGINNPTYESPVTVTCEEGMNQAPRIFVSKSGNTSKALLLDLNPDFEQVRFAKEEVIHWVSTDGHEIEGGLYLPPDYKPGQLYPLVIQLSGFDAERFWIDGRYSSAYAAQPLAAHGIVVLQVGRTKYREYVETTREGPRQMAAYEGAIDYLDSRGLIDRNRVGIIGFSRAGYPAAYTLTHSKYKFAAATLAEGFDGGYWNYLAYPNGSADMMAVNGGAPFGNGLPLWLANSPSFNMFKIQTPIRLEAYSRASVIGGWEWYSSLSQMGKPVDLVLLPGGAHELVKPLDRIASLQGNVDWFAFWLKGEEDPDPRRREQYRRWRELRTLQEQQDKAVPATD